MTVQRVDFDDENMVVFVGHRDGKTVSLTVSDTIAECYGGPEYYIEKIEKRLDELLI